MYHRGVPEHILIIDIFEETPNPPTPPPNTSGRPSAGAVRTRRGAEIRLPGALSGVFFFPFFPSSLQFLAAARDHRLHLQTD